MSDSRLEKFIYAICSMDVTDLPVPLSRIEKLWNCLITGETPDFEPLSRNEKYLMAMLDRYDISNLPAPTSRGEKLLYKIAVGETDLSDVPGYLSRYEELLKYLIENGGISGGDFEYVLYTLNQSLSTLYNTAEKPVKSAILSGNTLVNLLDKRSSDFTVNLEAGKNAWSKYCDLKQTLVAGKKYFIAVTVSENTMTTGRQTLYLNNGVNQDNQYSVMVMNQKKGYLTSVFTANFNTLKTVFVAREGHTTDGILTIKNDMILCEYQEGMENWDIPYFEGMQSVKLPVLTTTGKNLFNTSIPFNTDYYGSEGQCLPCYYDNEKKLIITDGISGQKNSQFQFLKFKPNTTYTFSGEIVGHQQRFCIHNESKQIEFNGIGHFSRTITTGDNGRLYVSILKVGTPNGVYGIENLQIEEGSTATSYEPYKSNILTVNEDVELRGIGDVQDTLDCLIGEVVERIGEMVLNGSEKWSIPTNFSNGDCKAYSLSVNGLTSNIVCDGLKILPNSLKYATEEGVFVNNNLLIVKKNIATRELFKQWLSQNPITVQYELETESIKTVDLTTVDQDGQPTKLKTFNDVSYVEMNADNIIPSVDVEVATKISETLSTLGLEHHDISETQNQLGQTINEQTENTDATMMATTEIYENL